MLYFTRLFSCSLGSTVFALVWLHIKLTPPRQLSTSSFFVQKKTTKADSLLLFLLDWLHVMQSCHSIYFVNFSTLNTNEEIGKEIVACFLYLVHGYEWYKTFRKWKFMAVAQNMPSSHLEKQTKQPIVYFLCAGIYE